MKSDGLLNEKPSSRHERRVRGDDRRNNIERRKQNAPDYAGPYRRMEPDRRMKILDRREENRVSAKEMRFELRIL